MAATNVGTITYTVDANTAKLLTENQKAEASQDALGASFKKTDAAAKGAQTQLTQTAAAARQVANESNVAAQGIDSLNKVIAAYVSLQGAQKVTALADAYTDLQNRLRLVTSNAAELAQATGDVFRIAQSTSQEVGTIATVYQRFAQNAKTLGLNLGQVADITQVVAQAVAISGASAASAQAALTQFGQALASGTLRGEELNSVMEQTPGLAEAIAKGLGISVGQLRAIAAEGEITSQQLVQALSKAAAGVEEQFNTRVKTVSQSFVELKNALMLFVGEANNASGATKGLVTIVDGLSKNLDTVVNLLLVAGAGALAKYIAGQGLALVATLRTSLAVRAQAADTLVQAQAHAAATAATAAQAAATVGLTTSIAASTAAATAAAAAQTSLAAAEAAASAAGVGLLGILGGPIGIIALMASAAAAVYLFGNNTANAVPQVDSLTNAIDRLSKAQLAQRKQQAEDAILQLQKNAIAAGQSVKGLEKDFNDLNDKLQSGKGGITSEGVENVRKALVDARAESDAAVKSLQEMINASAKISEEQKKREGPIQTNGTQQKDPEVQKRLNAMRDEVELAKLTGEARARLQAIQKLGKKATQEEREEAERLASQIYKLEDARKKEKEAASKAATEANKAANERKKEQEAVERAQLKDAETLKGLAQELALTAFHGKELAQMQAQLKLGEYATPEQIAAARELGGLLYEAAQRKAMLDAIGNDPNKYVEGNDPKPLSGGAFDNQAARYDAEAAAEDKRYQAQLDRLSVALEAQAMTLQEGFDLQEQLYQEHADRMEQIENAKQLTIYAAAEKGLAAATDGIKSAFGEQNALYKVAFAAQKAFAIAQSLVAIQQGIALAAANPFPMNLGAMASVAAATASIVSNISSVAMGGGKLYGGEVDPSKMYRVNENGAPEVFNSANGQQWMIPNSRGEVVSNADSTQRAAPNISIRVIEDANRGGEVTQRQNDNGDVEADVFVADIRGGGRRAQALEETYGLTRPGR